MRDLPHAAALTACVFQWSIQETLWAGDHTQAQAGVSLCICWWEVWEIFLSKLDTGSQKAKWNSGSFRIDLSPWLCDTRIIMFSHQNPSNCHIWICKLLITRCISHLGIKDNWGLDGQEFGWTPGVGDGQGGLACCKSWGRKESDTTEQLNWKELNWGQRKGVFGSNFQARPWFYVSSTRGCLDSVCWNLTARGQPPAGGLIFQT